MRLLSVIFFAFALSAQTSTYPGSVDTPTQLFVAKDNIQTSLSSPMAVGDNVAIVAISTGWAANMIATICDAQTTTGKCTTFEEMLVTAVNGNIISVTRAFNGTVAKAHASGKLFSNTIVSAYQAAASSALIAIEATLGANLANIPKSPYLTASQFAFQSNSGVQVSAPGGALVIGNNNLTWVQVPFGVNGTDSNHYVYVSGGVGTAEACLITGGSGTSGAANGVIIINCANTHSGAWSVQSSMGGVPEAIQQTVTVSGGGTVLIPPGTIPFYAHLTVPTKVTLLGLGNGSILQLAANMWPSASSGPFYCVNTATPQPCAIAAAENASGVRLSNFTLDMNGANNSGSGNGADILMPNCADCGTDHLFILNARNPGAVVAHIGPNSKNSLDYHDTIHGYGTGPCAGGILTTSFHGTIAFNYADGLCDAGFIANGAWTSGRDILIIGNHVESNAAAIAAGMFAVEGANNVRFIGNSANGPGNFGCFYIINAGSNGPVSDVTIADGKCGSNAAGSPVDGISIQSDGVNLTSNISVIGGTYQAASNANISISIVGNVAGKIANVLISGVQIRNGTAGIFVNTGATQVSVKGNSITNSSGAGVSILSATTAVSVLGNELNTNAGGDITDGSGVAQICNNHSDSAWNGLCNLTPGNSGTMSLANGANQNVTTTVGGITPNQTIFSAIGCSAPCSINGLASGYAGRILYLTNNTGQTLTITNQDAGSTATNRIVTPTGASITVQRATLLWDPTQNRWNVLSFQ